MLGGSRAASCVRPHSAGPGAAPPRATAKREELNPVQEGGSSGSSNPGSSGSSGPVAGPEERPIPVEADNEPMEDAEPSNLKAMRAPRDPTQEEIDDHEAAGHTPYRSWRRACVAGAGRRDRHVRQLKDMEKAVPTISVDYAFLGEPGAHGEGRATDMPILVTKCDADRWVTSDPVPCKGTSSSSYGAKCLAEVLVQSGYPKVILKTDNESAILELKREAVKKPRHTTPV